MARALPMAARLAAAVALAAGCASARPRAAAVETASWIGYVCESGREVAASYPDDRTAVVRYLGATYTMHIALSASGARYVGGGHEWWTRGSGPGSTGRLSRFAGRELTAETPLEACSVPAGEFPPPPASRGVPDRGADRPSTAARPLR